MKILQTFTTIFICLISLKAYVCQYTTATFGNQISSSDLIIKGKVLNTHGYDLDLDTAIVTIAISKVVKGSWTHDTISIVEKVKVFCPGPVVYTEGMNVFTFLRLNKDNGYYSTNNFFLGMLPYENSHEENLYEKRITEYIKTIRIQKKRKRFRYYVDWVIDCYEKDKTKDKGLEEFSRGMFHHHLKEKKENGTFKYARLTKEQKKKLRSIITRNKEFAFNESVIIDLVAKKNDKEMIQLAINQIEKYNRKKGIWYKEYNLMQSIIKITKSDSDIISVFRELDKVYFNRADRIEMNKLTDSFIKIVKDKNGF